MIKTKRIAVLLTCVLATLIIVALGGCGESETDMETDVEEAAAEGPSQPEADAVAEDYDYISAFIDDYNAVSTTPLTVVDQFDPHDGSSADYRHEYHSAWYDGSLGMYCTSGSVKVWIVNYGSRGGYYSNNKLRIYCLGPKDETIEVFSSAALVLDPSLATEELVSKAEETLGSNSHAGTIYLDNSSLETISIDRAVRTSSPDYGERTLPTEEEVLNGYLEALLESDEYIESKQQ
ncbi:MAG: hypothetical protein IJG82_00615 [Atopobiaceae bacterium]|nr:hypothetical protein [Atopobiaceae bacterium]MBQ6523695.1 hypothetical protein [Atopobiaceae bacterium]